jgi:hypothetical protein
MMQQNVAEQMGSDKDLWQDNELLLQLLGK